MMTEQEVTTPILTEEQILQMPESDYMNDAQLAFFRARLRQMEADIRNNAGETTEHLRETVIVPDPPTVPPSRKSMRWSCARATVNASC